MRLWWILLCLTFETPSDIVLTATTAQFSGRLPLHSRAHHSAQEPFTFRSNLENHQNTHEYLNQ